MIGRRELNDDERFSLRRAAVHEAGHAALAAHYGVTGQIHVLPVVDHAAPWEFKFTGSFVPHVGEFADPHAKRLYALAGIAAEGIDGGWDSVVHVLIRSMMSDADAHIAGEFKERDVVETIGLLKWLWVDVEHRAEVAMEPWLRGPLPTADSIDNHDG